jgi:hypothetical protein
MNASGVYYHREMDRMVNGHGCIVCSQAYETDVWTDLRYPYISPVCKCTLCRACIDERLAQIVGTNKVYTVECPLCEKPKAWNKRNLVPNKQLANLLHDMKRVIANAGKDECHGGGSSGSDDNDGKSRKKNKTKGDP